MVELFDGDGNPVDGAMTKEEVEAKVEAEKAELTTQIEDTKLEVEEAKTEAAKTKADLETLQKGDKNWKAAREAKESADAKVKELEGKVNELGQKVESTTKATEERTLAQEIAKLSGGDTEVAKKIKYHFDKFTKADTEEKRQENLQSAAILATGGKPGAGVGSGGSFSSGGGSPAFDAPKEGKGKLSSSEASDVGAKLGLSTEEQKKAGLI